MKRTDGFALIYTMLAGVLIITLAAMMAAAQVMRTTSTSNVTRLASMTTAQRGALTYAQRLTAAHASRWVKATEASTDPATIMALLQQAANATLCSRNVHGQLVRLHVTSAACDRGLPPGATLQAPVRVASVTGATHTWTVPYVLATTDGTNETFTTGSLRYTDGAAFASTYALWAGSLPNAQSIRSTGPVYVLGAASVQGTAEIHELHVAGCTAVAPACVGSGGLVLGDTAQSTMTFTPSPVQPCTTIACVSGRVNARASTTFPTTPGLSSVVTVLYGGVMSLMVRPDGQQGLRHCAATCNEYAYAPGSNVIVVNYGSPTVRADVAGEPSVTNRLTIYATGNITVESALTLANPPCETDTCPQPTNMLGLISERDIALNAPVEAGLFGMGNVVGNGVQDVMGSVVAYGTASNLSIRHDPRMMAVEGQAPPVWPTLSSRTNNVMVDPHE